MNNKVILNQVTDENRIECTGSNGSIKRKNGKVIPIVSSEEMFKARARALKDSSKMEDITKLEKANPKIEEGDTIISGEDTIIHLSLGGNLKKEAGLEDGVLGKSIYLFENTQIKVSGVKHFEKEDKKKDAKYFIDSVKNIEVLNGSFQTIFLGNGAEIETPFAKLKFYGKGISGFFDITSSGLYTFPQLGPDGKIEYVCKRTKKSYVTKDYKPNEAVFPTEIVITNDGIYKVPFTQGDNPSLGRLNVIMLKTMKPSMEMTQITLPQQEKMMESLASGEFQNQMFSGMEALKNMSPEDLKRLAKKGDANVTPEQMEMLAQVPEMMKKMESSGKMAEMKKGYAQLGGMFAGMNKGGMASFSKIQEKSMEKFNVESNKMLEEYKKAKKEPYKPIKAEYKIA